MARITRTSTPPPVPRVKQDPMKFFRGASSFHGLAAMAIRELPRVRDVVVDAAAWKKLNAMDPNEIRAFSGVGQFLSSRSFKELGLRARFSADVETTLYIMGEEENIKALDKLSAHEPEKAAMNLRKFSSLVGE